MFLGDNQSKSKGIIYAIKNAQSYGANCCQIFLRSPMRKSNIKISQDDINNCKNYLQNNNLKLIIHSSYLYNFCKPTQEINWAIQELSEEINYASKLGAIGCIIHMGKTTDIPFNDAMQNFINNINTICQLIPNNDAKLILENSANQGTEIGYNMEQILYIHSNINTNNLHKIGYCIDTCHAFAAGYDIKNSSNIIQEFVDKIGLQFLQCIHINDSKKELHCKVDRHENIDQGFIGSNGLKNFIQTLIQMDYQGIFILETPDESKNNRIREINLLKN